MLVLIKKANYEGLKHFLYSKGISE